MLKWWYYVSLLQWLYHFPVSEMFSPEEWRKAEMSLYKIKAWRETSFLVDHFKAKPNKRLWTDSAQYNKLVKVKYELCLLSWVEHKSFAALAYFPVFFLHVDLRLSLAWDGEQDKVHNTGCGEDVVGLVRQVCCLIIAVHINDSRGSTCKGNMCVLSYMLRVFITALIHSF